MLEIARTSASVKVDQEISSQQEPLLINTILGHLSSLTGEDVMEWVSSESGEGVIDYFALTKGRTVVAYCEPPDAGDRSSSRQLFVLELFGFSDKKEVQSQPPKDDSSDSLYIRVIYEEGEEAAPPDCVVRDYYGQGSDDFIPSGDEVNPYVIAYEVTEAILKLRDENKKITDPNGPFTDQGSSNNI